MSCPPDASGRRDYLAAHVLPALDVRPFIGGAFVEPRTDATFAVGDPTTEQALVTMPAAGKADVEAAVEAARSAFDEGPWPRMSPSERGAVLNRLAGIIDRDLEDLALLESADAGKRFQGVRAWDIPHAATVYRYYAEWAGRIYGDTLPPAGPVRVSTQREPVGVCAAIIPWNFPFACISWKMAPALAAGCTVVIKAAERAPLSAQALASRFAEAGFPPGVVNVVTGAGDVAGAALASDARIDKITFTGSAETARSITRGSSWRMPRLTTELGGKGANVVFADADLDAALDATTDAVFDLSGQNCCAAGRTYVQREVYEEFVGRLVKQARSRRLGDPLDDSTQQGPLIDRDHLRTVSGMVTQALDDGARLLTGGSPAELGGLFYEPTLLGDVSAGDRISREEVFGPVGCVYPFTDLDEVVALANDSDYGLSASVWTSRPGTADSFAERVRVGTCWVNCFGYFLPYVPWGGVKLSGNGHDLGREGIEAFLSTKVVYRAP
ncbi:aldehyde dehydrogenase family protein [Streptomyces sp. cmx-18-6]|uniref:aldehyde dehydrogenase family protein n=1 Tax=Streptomyces sp. cmx-18-6 TaxID=2790930 RepID=UPI00397F2FD7